MEIEYEVMLPDERDTLLAARARIGARPCGGTGDVLLDGPEAAAGTATLAVDAEAA